MFNKKVVVAISGGVDSSVAAALLKEKGFDVIGVFLYFWGDTSRDQENKCCSYESKERAKEVARILRIPFYTFDFKKEFKKYIVDYFINEHKKGFTPNPCVECNRIIKFGFLFDKILSLGADYLATGHYVKLKVKNLSRAKPAPSKAEGSRDEKLKVRYKLFRAKDRGKDQSYFLYNLTQEKLSRLLFPIGDYTKAEVRKLAGRFNLPTYNAKESQDVCFISRGGLEKFLKKHIKTIKPGYIINTRGETIGKHEGLLFYTIGQRKGIEISGGKAYYVVDKDIKNKELIVSDNFRDKKLFSKSLKVSNINWISESTPIIPLREVESQIRYRQIPVKSQIIEYNKHSQSCLVEFIKPERAATCGQSAVFYKKDELLGGGIISLSGLRVSKKL